MRLIELSRNIGNIIASRRTISHRSRTQLTRNSSLDYLLRCHVIFSIDLYFLPNWRATILRCIYKVVVVIIVLLYYFYVISIQWCGIVLLL